MTVTVEQTRTRFSDGRRIVLDENARLLNSIAAEQWDRAGLSVDEATAALDAVNLAAVATDPIFDSNVPDGVVISAAPQEEGAVRPGSAIVLTISKGPDLVTIPDVVGMGMQEAIDTLKAAEFEVSYQFPEPLFPFAKVVQMEPGAGTQAERHSTIKLTAQVTL